MRATATAIVTVTVTKTNLHRRRNLLNRNKTKERSRPRRRRKTEPPLSTAAVKAATTVQVTATVTTKTLVTTRRQLKQSAPRVQAIRHLIQAATATLKAPVRIRPLNGRIGWGSCIKIRIVYRKVLFKRQRLLIPAKVDVFLEFQ